MLDKISERLPITLLLNLVEMLIILAAGHADRRVLSATRQYSLFDKVTTVFVFVGFATPDFWLALLLMILFGVQLGWLPISGLRSLNFEYLTFWQQHWDFLRHLILPVGGRDLRRARRVSRATCGGACSRSIRQDYIQTARAKGLPERVVIYKHALRNALLPVVTLLGLIAAGADRRQRDHRVDLRHPGHGPALRTRRFRARLPV